LGVLGALSRDDDEEGDIGARGEVVACAAAFDEEEVDDEVVLASLSMSPLAPPFRPADPVLIERERDDIFPCPLSLSQVQSSGGLSPFPSTVTVLGNLPLLALH
jgi:hypothetical protein